MAADGTLLQNVGGNKMRNAQRKHVCVCVRAHLCMCLWPYIFASALTSGAKIIALLKQMQCLASSLLSLQTALSPAPAAQLTALSHFNVDAALTVQFLYKRIKLFI